MELKPSQIERSSDPLCRVLQPIAKARGLPNECYTSDETFERERQRVFADGWCCVGFSLDAPTAGDQVALDFVGFPLLMVRCEDHILRLFHNVCPHRGHILVSGETENGKAVVCPYHRWSYRLTGELIAAPHVGGPGQHSCPAFDQQNVALSSIRCAEWRGLVFADISGTAEEFSDYIGALEARWRIFDKTPFVHTGSDATIEFALDCNWKLAVENYCEAYHLPWGHPDLNRYSPLDRHSPIAEAGFAGQISHSYDPKPAPGSKPFPDATGLDGFWKTGAEYIALFPNLLLGLHRDHYFAVLIQPDGPRRTKERLELFYFDERVRGPDYEASRGENRTLWQTIFAEDRDVVENMQRGRQSPGYDGGTFSPVMDTPTHAFHLATALQDRGQGSGSDILVLDKTSIAAGASGIACGVVRNNYFQPAMRELMAHSVSVWESDPEAYSYHPVGYMQISHEGMRADVAAIHEQQQAIGYPSDFIEGAAQSEAYMKRLLPDWQAQGITSVLHEKKGGYANNTKALYGLAGKAEAAGVRILTGVTVTGLRRDGGSISAVETDRGTIATDYIVACPGPWAKSVWDMLDLPGAIAVKGADGTLHEDIPMWTYWSLQEGTLGVEPNVQMTADGEMPPVIHVDTDAPLLSDVDGSVITEEPWGIYYKPDFHFGGVQGGAMPYTVETDPAEVAVDPYGVESPDFVVGDDFAHMWCSALAHCQKRFEGQIGLYKKEPSGGIGCFTPDSFPVFDVFHENCYLVADSNHGFKMIGVGKLVAEEVTGAPSKLLEPFRLSRYAEGKLHPISNSPFPWS